MSQRANLIFILFLLIFSLLVARLFTWQVIKGELLGSQAKGQYQLGKVVSAPRGSIMASDGSLLAARREAWLLYITPPELKEPVAKIADKLAPLLEDDAGRIKSLLAKEGMVWIPIKHKIPSEIKRNIEALGIVGVGFEKEEARAYPEASAAAQLLGFVGKNEEGEDIGYFGLEGYYNLPLVGKSGFLSQEKDAKGIPILLGDFSEISAIGGVNLITHLDKTVQMILEKKLKEGIEKYGAKAGTVIVADPKTGAILGMASYPSYDPLRYSEYSDEYFKNPAISDTFEPGSVFKVLVMAAALDAGAVEPQTKCDICSGPLRVDKYLIETWNKEYFPDTTMTEVVVHSDNVGMAFVGQKLGADALYDYLDRFGIGQATGIDLQGEVAAPLRKKGTWNIVDLATASFGQGIAVTPIEMVRAVSAIANQGKLPQIRVVAKISGEGWEETIKGENKPVISLETAEKVKSMMIDAARSGEAKWTSLKGFKVAGKTGTAQIPIAGHYDAEKTIGSFIGFAPADDPKFIMLVTLREPQTSPWASETAAPLWYAIARDLFLHFGIQPEN
jgi:cell division protein FtsI/penicillin-binding protein 2